MKRCNYLKSSPKFVCRMNIPLFRKLGDLGLLGLTAPEQYGGSGDRAFPSLDACCTPSLPCMLCPRSMQGEEEFSGTIA